MLIKYFSQVGEMWQIDSGLRSMVTFKPLNLLHDFSHLGVFDVVFCRNVLIYFDQETKTDVLTRLVRVTERDGFLALGAAETVVGLTDAFKPVVDKRGLYAPHQVVPRAPDNVVSLAGAAARAAAVRSVR
jgi:chemotaxis protein methyltransferase CheR